jgi:hypothetical protein
MQSIAFHFCKKFDYIGFQLFLYADSSSAEFSLYKMWSIIILAKLDNFLDVLDQD